MRSKRSLSTGKGSLPQKKASGQWRNASKLTLDNHHDLFETYHNEMKLSRVDEGFKQLRKDVHRAQQRDQSAATIIQVCKNFDFNNLYTKSTRQGKPCSATEIDTFSKCDASKYLQVYCQGQHHHVTHLVDQNNVHFASICWRHNYSNTSEITVAISTLSDKIFETVDGRRGKKFSTAHAKLEGPGQASPRNAKGQFDLYYN